MEQPVDNDTAQAAASALVFDLNYNEHTSHAEAGALCRQLTMAFAANRRASPASRFPLLVLGGTGLPPPSTGPPSAPPGEIAPRLVHMLHKSNWWSGTGVYRSWKTAPWKDAVAALAADPPPDVIYLTADSPEELYCAAPAPADDGADAAPNVAEGDVSSGGAAAAATGAAGTDGAFEAAALATRTVFVIGGLVDRDDKWGMSFERAKVMGLRTARLPLMRFLRLRNKKAGAGKEDGVGAADITTLAVVQILLLFRETRDWGLAVSRCPALRCAPLRKYVHWLPPYEHLNGVERPKHFFNDTTGTCKGAQGHSKTARKGQKKRKIEL